MWPFCMGLARLNVMHGDLPFHAPGKEVPRRQFGAIIHSQSFRNSALRNDIVQNARDA
jgi:hypothetical protein